MRRLAMLGLAAMLTAGTASARSDGDKGIISQAGQDAESHDENPPEQFPRTGLMSYAEAEIAPVPAKTPIEFYRPDDSRRLLDLHPRYLTALERMELQEPQRASFKGGNTLSTSFSVLSDRSYRIRKAEVGFKHEAFSLDLKENLNEGPSHREMRLRIPTPLASLTFKANNKGGTSFIGSIPVPGPGGFSLRAGMSREGPVLGLDFEHSGRKSYSLAIIEGSRKGTTSSAYALGYFRLTNTPFSVCAEHMDYDFSGYSWKYTSLTLNGYFAGKALESVYGYVSSTLDGSRRSTWFQAGAILKVPFLEGLSVSLGADNYYNASMKANPRISATYVRFF